MSETILELRPALIRSGPVGAPCLSNVGAAHCVERRPSSNITDIPCPTNTRHGKAYAVSGELHQFEPRYHRPFVGDAMIAAVATSGWRTIRLGIGPV